MSYLNGILRVEVDGIEYNVEYIALYNEILDELCYEIVWNKQYSFVMAMDFELGRLVINGAAPYISREVEEIIASEIEHAINKV